MEGPKPKFRVGYRPKVSAATVARPDPKEQHMVRFQKYLDSIDYDYQAMGGILD